MKRSLLRPERVPEQSSELLHDSAPWDTGIAAGLQCGSGLQGALCSQRCGSYFRR